MSETRARDIASGLYRNLWILAVLTIVFLVVLAAAPFKWHNSEWRDAQHEYNRRAKAVGQNAMAVSLQQIWRPEIDLTDRCTSCHVGMGASKPLPEGGKLYGAHPDVHHPVAQMGCTICHSGQGRATTAKAAHGAIKHWESPMLPSAHLQASCGGCHGDAAIIPPQPAYERGAYLFELHGCRACHLVDGMGGDIGPDLSGVALKGFDREWHIQHLRAPSSVVEDSLMMSFGHLSMDEIDSILAYLDTLIGAPDLVRGKILAVRYGCRGCHKIGGLGGEESVDLNEAAAKSIGEYDFSFVEGEHSLENWHRQHLRDPLRVAPGSTMPVYLLDPEDETDLVTYILSMRLPEVNLEQLPRETVLARLQERRDFSSDGSELYGVFCAACHGPDGAGQVMPALGTTVPSLRTPEVQTVMSAESLRYVLEHGRPGRFMPAWGVGGGGLDEAELDAIIGWLRRDMPTPPSFDEVRAAGGNRRKGEDVFLHACAACHGADGRGTEIAPGLINAEFQFVADDEYLYRTITEGRAGTAMPAHPAYSASTVADLITWIRAEGTDRSPAARRRERNMQKAVVDFLRVRKLEDYRASGSPAYGKTLFEAMCASCHGDRGRGLIGPAIGTPGFLSKASDGFLAGTIVLGRSGRAMRSFGPLGLAKLEGREVGDLITYLRSVALEPPEKPGYRTVQGTIPHGEKLFGSYCAGCHGSEGQGLTAPALRNPAFLDAVSDGFLQATLVRGRPGTAMRAWGRGGFGFEEIPPQEINDIVAYIRSWQADTP